MKAILWELNKENLLIIMTIGWRGVAPANCELCIVQNNYELITLKAEGLDEVNYELHPTFTRVSPTFLHAFV